MSNVCTCVLRRASTGTFSSLALRLCFAESGASLLPPTDFRLGGGLGFFALPAFADMAPDHFEAARQDGH